MTVRAEIVTVRCKRLPQSTQCVTSGRYVRLIVCWYSFFFLMTFPCSLALFATLLSILSPHVGREYCPHGGDSPNDPSDWYAEISHNQIVVTQVTSSKVTTYPLVWQGSSIDGFIPTLSTSK